MRFITLLVATSFLLQATESDAQQKVSFNVKRVSLENLILEIVDPNEHPFTLDNDQFRKCPLFTGKADSLELSKALDLCFRNQPLTYRMEGPVIYFIPRDVTGYVMDETGERLAGVTITCSSPGKNTTTNEKGEFRLHQAALDSIIELSAVNLVQQQVLINGKSRLIISMRKKITPSGDTTYVVVRAASGYDQLPVERSAGAFAVLSQQQLSNRTSQGVWDRTDHTAAGVRVTPSGRQGNRFPAITIRGISTIYASKQPLLVVDRFPYDGNLSSINPNDIETITILKDAAATSIWGARAGNGVIVITTRQGRYNRRANISFISNLTISEKPDSWYLPVLGSADYLEVEEGLFSKHFYDGALNSGYRLVSPAVEIMAQRRAGSIDSIQARTALNQLAQQDVRYDYDKYYYRRSVAQQYALSVRGGGSQHKYYIGAGYDKELSGFTGGANSRITLTAVNIYKPVKALEINTTVAMIKTIVRNDTPFPDVAYPYSMLAGTDGSPLAVDYGLRQSWKQRLPQNRLLDWSYRPLEELSLRNDSTHRMNIRLLTEIRYCITADLHLSLAYQYLQETSRHSNTLSMQSYAFRDLSNRFAHQQGNTISSPVPQGPIEDWQQGNYQAENLRLQANYRHLWRDNCQFTMLAGAEVWDATNDTSGGRTYNDQADLTTRFPLYYDTIEKQQLPGKPVQTGTYDRYISWVANIGFTMNGRYTANISGRIDQSNLLGVNTNHKTVPLWSAGLKWDIANEPFNKTAWLNRLSLRTSFGYSGNIDKSVSALLTIAPAVTNRYGASTSTILNAANPDLRWEKISMFNVGLDFSLFSKHLSGSLEYYIRRGNDLLDNFMTAPSQGSLYYRSNTGSLKGHGVEAQLESHQKIGKLDWSSILLFSFTTHTITAYGNPKYTASDYLNPAANNLRTGFPSTAIYSLRWGGLNPANGDPVGYLHGVASYAYEDILKGPVDSLLYNGPSTPPYSCSMGNSFRIGQWECSFLITGQFGYCFRRPSINYSALFSGRDPGNTDYLLRWQKPGDETTTNVPSLSYSGNEYRDQFYTYAAVLVEKADNIRVREIRISYCLGKRLQQRLHVSTATLFLYAANVGILWKATDSALDPDSFNAIPVPRSLSLGFKFNF